MMNMSGYIGNNNHDASEPEVASSKCAPRPPQGLLLAEKTTAGGEASQLPISPIRNLHKKELYESQLEHSFRRILCFNNLRQSDSSQSESDERQKRLLSSARKKKLPPIGVFWDIENCQVPKFKSAASVAQLIREMFFVGYREAEFMVVCDVKKEHPLVIQELNDAQVNLIHVNSTCKNSADEKLRQAMRKFAEIHRAPAAVILISGDVNFAPDLSDLRYKKNIYVILIHKQNVAEPLVQCAHEHYDFNSFLHFREAKSSQEIGPFEVVVKNLPVGIDVYRIKIRLKQLSDNCGGRVCGIDPDCATLRFTSMDSALRAQKRMNGEDVFGQNIIVSFPTPMRGGWNKPHNSFKPYSLRGPRHQENGSMARKNEYAAERNGLDAAAPNAYYTQVTDQFYKQPIAGDGQFSDDEYFNMEVLPPAENQCQTFQQGQLSKQQSLWTSDEDDNICINFIKFGPSGPSVEVVVSDLDPAVEINEMRKMLLAIIKEHAMVLNINLSKSMDNSYVARIKVANAQDAHNVMYQLRKQKVGNRRLNYSNANASYASYLQNLRSQIVTLLQEVPGNKMPLFKFRELLDSRNHSVPISELYKLRDTCTVTEELGGRMISLAPELRLSPSPFGIACNNAVSYCTTHCPKGLIDRGWAEQEVRSLPNVMIGIAELSMKVKALINSHNQMLPLASFAVCYFAEFKETLPINDAGVPLEHLVTCIPGVQIRSFPYMVKYLVPNSNPDEAATAGESEAMSQFKAPMTPIAIQMLQFSREIVELLKTIHHCILPFSKFIPAYHHHFGKQCRVSDYGYLKLIDLVEAMPHVIQIIGEGNKRCVTLTHSAQIRRFTSDLLKMLKTQTARQVSVLEFPAVYERIMGKPFDPVDYGMCLLDDLLCDVCLKTALMVTTVGDDVIVGLPRREQTPAEVRKTKQFAVEVVELLKHTTHYRILFHKFVPAYHHHFNHQCRVSDYGFTKLIELFEAIPEVVDIEMGEDGERLVCLTATEALNVLNDQVVQLLKASDQYSIALDDLPLLFMKEYGFPLRPELYHCASLPDLIEKLSKSVQLIPDETGFSVTLVGEFAYNMFELRVWALLVKPPHSMPVLKFLHEYYCKYGHCCTIAQLSHLTNVIEVVNETVLLTKMYVLAARLYQILYESSGVVQLRNLENLYMRHFNAKLLPSDYGYDSIMALLGNFAFLLDISNRRNIKTLLLRRKVMGIGLPFSARYTRSEDTSAQKNVVHWPPPPLHMLFSSIQAISPPKPDTPPTQGSSVWDTHSWCPNVDINIPMPNMVVPNWVEKQGESLISPEKTLLQAYKFVDVKPPDPSELPMPNPDFFRGTILSSNSVPLYQNEEGKLEETSPSQAKYKSRLSAQFSGNLD